MLKKLRIKFVCINMTIISVMLVVIMTLVIHFTGQNLEQTSIQRMEEIATNPVYQINPMESSGSRLPYFTLQINHKGELLDSHSGYYDLSDRNFLETLVDTTSGIQEKTGVLKDYQLRFLRISVPNGQFLVYADISGEISTMENLTRNCIFIGILSFCAFLGISIYLANWAVKPVDKAWDQQKQFIADASHELKTPLTVILTNAELLKCSDYDQDNKARFSDNILVMAKQMRGLVEGLLELSRIDNHSMKTIMEPFNFSELPEISLCLFEPLYYEAGLDCVSEITPNLQVKGSPSHLKQVLDILFDNALKYADHDSRISVRLEKQKKYALLSVTSYGDTIAPEDLKNIFKRFYRADKSRTSSQSHDRTSSGSYGLGLSIAESIVREHKGKIWAESQDGKNCFYVRLGLN